MRRDENAAIGKERTCDVAARLLKTCLTVSLFFWAPFSVNPGDGCVDELFVKYSDQPV